MKAIKFTQFSADAAIRRTEIQWTLKLSEVLAQLEAASRRLFPRIAVKTKGRVLFINPVDVVAVEAKGNYVLLQRQSGSCFVNESITAIADSLRPYGFIRIHRSVVVNTLFVEEIQPCTTGEYLMRIKGGKVYTATRTYKENFKLLAEIWIGTGLFAAEQSLEESRKQKVISEEGL